MEQYVINGGCELYGSVPISGAKNAALGILPAVFLCRDTCRIENLPQISDVNNMLDILASMGAHIRYLNKNAVEIDTSHAKNLPTPYEMVRRLRASYYLIGALLAALERRRWRCRAAATLAFARSTSTSREHAI